MARNSSQIARPRSSRKPTAGSSLAIAIMAAGKGTRLKSKRPKVLQEIAGKPLLEFVIAAARKVVGREHIFTIIGYEADKVRAAVETSGVNFVLQAEQRGTGHAIIVARPALERYDHIIVLSGDAPLIREKTIRTLRDFHLAKNAAMTILTAIPADATGYGRIVRKAPRSDQVRAIVEEKMLGKSQPSIGEINSGIYMFAAKPLFGFIHQLTTNNPHGEYYLTDMAALLTRAKHRVVALAVEDPSEVLGANTFADLALLDASVRQNKTRELMSQGVAILRPDSCLIDYDVQVGPDTTIEPYTQLLGTTKIGSNCRIKSFSVISNSEVANGVLIRNGCILDQAKIGPHAMIGPYSHLRAESDIGERAQVGNFVETKKTRLGTGSKANHLSYLGDADIASGVNIGAGTITCNYDGVHKHRTTIEENVFVGSDSTLVAPVSLKRGAYVGAGSCITEDVPEDSLALGRSRQVIKPGWARERRGNRAKSG